MIIIRIILKIAAIPVIAVLTLIKWVMLFVTLFSRWIFYILAGVLFLTGILSYGFGLEPGKECLKILGTGFFIFMVLVIASEVVGIVTALHAGLIDFLCSRP